MSDFIASLKTKISTPKFAETREFYKRLLRMVVVEEWNEEGDKGVILAFDKDRREALLEIYECVSSHSFSGTSLQFRVTDVEAFCATLPNDLNYEGPKARPWGSRYVYIRDPNDIQLIVYEGGF